MTALRAEGCGRLSAAGYVRFAQGATAPAALRVADCRSAAMLIKSALRDDLAVSYGIISILRIGSLRSPPPIRAAPDFSTGKRVTRFSGRFAPLRIVFPCHPYAGGRIKHLEASLHKHLYSKHGLLCHRLRGKGGGASHQRGISLALKGGWLFPLGRKPGCEGFIIRGRLL